LAQAEVRKLEDAEQCARLIRLAVGAPLTAGAHQITTTVSVGTAIFPQHGGNVAEMTKAADLALYTAKSDGRDMCRMYHPDMDAALQIRQKIEKALRRAVAAESFTLHFQPIVRAEEKKLLGFEVLLRLESETGEEIPPTAFIPIAEGMGLISQIGSWVIKKACKAAIEWPDYLTVSVNMSPRQFENGELCAIVADALRESGLAPHRLELEITEGLLVADTEGVMTQLRQLKALGVLIAMDDFGTGYSSLSYLWRFPFDKLKIDRSFMEVLVDGDEHVGNILNTIVSLGRTLNLKVTAEGVETQEQADFLKGLNCDQLQGYHFGRPMPESDIAAVILKDGCKLALLAQERPFADDTATVRLRDSSPAA
jgi:predicted signal transduction protein with EAL and GGDEF domain